MTASHPIRAVGAAAGTCPATTGTAGGCELFEGVTAGALTAAAAGYQLGRPLRPQHRGCAATATIGKTIHRAAGATAPEPSGAIPAVPRWARLVGIQAVSADTTDDDCHGLPLGDRKVAIHTTGSPASDGAAV